MCGTSWCRGICGGKNWGLFVLRVAVGVIFFKHGWDKVADWPAAVDFFVNVVNIPGFFAYIVGTVELVGGALLILGLFVRPAAILLGAVMVGAIALVKAKMGFSRMEIDIALLGSALALAALGGGRWGLSRWCKCGCHKSGGDCKVCDAIGCGSCGHGTCNHDHDHDHSAPVPTN